MRARPTNGSTKRGSQITTTGKSHLKATCRMYRFSVHTSFPSLKDPSYDPGPDQLHTGEVVTFRSRGRSSKTGKIPAGRSVARTTTPSRSAWRTSCWSSSSRTCRGYASTSTTIEALYSALDRPLPCVRWRGPFTASSATPERFRTKSLRPRSPIKNLYMAGSKKSHR